MPGATERTRCVDPLELCMPLKRALEHLLQMHTATAREQARTKIILGLNGFSAGITQAAIKLGRDVKTVRTWYRRAAAWSERFPELLKQASQEPGRAGAKSLALRFARQLLQDEPRSGRPMTYSARDYLDIMGIALTAPQEAGRPITHWTSREIAEEAKKREICAISQRQIARFLDQVDLQPHKFRYWLNPKIEDGHDERVRAVCDVYAEAATQPKNTRIVSVDEKTSIQAKERLHPDKSAKLGHVAKLEAEYGRHGTLCLMPSFDVVVGKIIVFRLEETRTEADFAAHIENTINVDPDAKWIFVADQLNTHVSEMLVRLVAERIDYKGDLGKKGVRGVLQSVLTRRAFLEDLAHKIRFVYTPKHCSWLNQVEIWFGVLVRKLLMRGSFASKAALRQAIENFIEYFNRTMAPPYQWTYQGKPLQA
jgi:hypothetical protein